MTTPGNTNPNVLKSLLENIAPFGSQDEDKATVCFMRINEETNAVMSQLSYNEIKALNDNGNVLFIANYAQTQLFGLMDDEYDFIKFTGVNQSFQKAYIIYVNWDNGTPMATEIEAY